MRTSLYSVNNPIFMAHTYKVTRLGGLKISTDNEKNLGKEPVLVYDNGYNTEECPMEKDGDVFTGEAWANDKKIKYHIKYNDTGKVDLKDGKDYEINPQKMQYLCNDYLLNKFRQPSFTPYKTGKIVAKVCYLKTDQALPEIKEPTILVTRSNYINMNSPNIVGKLYSRQAVDLSKGEISILKNNYKVSAIIDNYNLFDKLKNLDGKKIELEVTDDSMKFEKTDKPSTTPMVYPKIVLPKLQPCDRILTSKEYTPDIIGMKAVNLRKLEELKEQGKINVKIPESIALPEGYFQNLINNNPKLDEIWEENKKRQLYSKSIAVQYAYCDDTEERMLELKKVMKENNLGEYVNIQPICNNYNLLNYSAEKLYDNTNIELSDTPKNSKNLYMTLTSEYYASSDMSSIIKIQKKYGISENELNRGVLIQKDFNSDYTFDINTSIADNKIKIELSNNNYYNLYSDGFRPNIFTYDKKTGELSYDSIQLINQSTTFDEDGNIIDYTDTDSNLSQNKKILEQVKQIAENALTVEKEFGYPQLIEGGISGDDIYFSGTCNVNIR